MPALAENHRDVYSIAENYNLYEQNKSVVVGEVIKKATLRVGTPLIPIRTTHFIPPATSAAVASVNNQNRLKQQLFPSGNNTGVLIVSPRVKTPGNGFNENRVSPATGTGFLLTAQNGSCCCNNCPSCRYREKFNKKFHTTTTINPTLLTTISTNQTKIYNPYEPLVYQTEVLKMEKIANFRERVSVSHVQMPRKDIWKTLGAEFLGTFILMILGCGCGLYLSDADKPTLLGGAFCWGLAVATLAQSLGHVSGCHINPAVTTAMLVTRKIELVKAGLYIVTQCIAAIVAIAVLKALTPTSTKGSFGVVSVADNLTALQGFGVEFITTFILIFIIFSVSDEGRTDIQGSPPLAIGLCISALIIFAGNFTGAGLNPARALGPAVVMGEWADHWVYWVGPIGGAITAAAVYEHIFRVLRPEEIEAAELAKQLRVREPEAKDGGMAPPV